jgi:hypothetical protein
MKYLVLALVLVFATSAFGLEKRAYQMREDFGTEPLQQCPDALQFYYYIPCPTYSWFWAYSGWDPGDVVGMAFPIGKEGTGGYPAVDPYNCEHLEYIRVLDFAGYGTVYPGLFTVQFDFWCCVCYPVHVHIWLHTIAGVETGFGWNYIPVLPVLPFCPCPWVDHPTFSGPVVVATATHTGTLGDYPAWGLDNISTSLAQACEMHEIGCKPAEWPRYPPGPMYHGLPHVHGGYFGTDPTNCPPMGIPDGRDTTPDVTQFGYIELAWRIYICCWGWTATEPTTWSNIKSMYR